MTPTSQRHCCAAQAVGGAYSAVPKGLDTVDESETEQGGGGPKRAARKRARPRGRRSGRQVKEGAGHEPRPPRVGAKGGCHVPPPAMVLHLTVHPCSPKLQVFVLINLNKPGTLIRHISLPGKRRAVLSSAGVYHLAWPTTLHDHVCKSLHGAPV